MRTTLLFTLLFTLSSFWFGFFVLLGGRTASFAPKIYLIQWTNFPFPLQYARLHFLSACGTSFEGATKTLCIPTGKQKETMFGFGGEATIMSVNACDGREEVCGIWRLDWLKVIWAAGFTLAGIAFLFLLQSICVHRGFGASPVDGFGRRVVNFFVIFCALLSCLAMLVGAGTITHFCNSPPKALSQYLKQAGIKQSCSLATELMAWLSVVMMAVSTWLLWNENRDASGMGGNQTGSGGGFALGKLFKKHNAEAGGGPDAGAADGGNGGNQGFGA
ncbi:MAG: hypothetical protein M1820_002176 [Bogoriella megaspora]|nr:MAG: hypothetical protein M1820_002176 [Bogoriella megaspora]